MTTTNSLRSLLTPVAAAGPGRSHGGAPAGLLTMRGGVPDPAHFPVKELAAAAARVLSREPSAALSYGGAVGALELREFIAARTRADDHRPIDTDNILVTTGGNHGLALLFEALLSPGDGILMEAPTYAGVVGWVRSRGIAAQPTPMDEHGLQVDLLEERLQANQRAGHRTKFIYTISTFHNPTGAEMALERRKRLVELAAKWGFLIIEDETYKDLRFEGDPIPSIFSLGGPELVAKIGSFSKTVAPGIRLGWVLADPDLLAALTGLRTDLGSSPLMTKTVAEYAAEGRFAAHVEHLCKLYASKRDRMITALEENCAPYLTWNKPRGGFFLWLKLAPGLQVQPVLAQAQQRGFDFNPGSGFYVDKTGNGFVRLCFATPTLEQIDRGVAILGQALANTPRS